MTYKKIIIDESKRLFFVGDIHGCFDLYERGCENFGITKQDVVIGVGDLIDRGTQNLSCVLEFTKKENRYAVMGNHEDLLIKSFIDNSQPHYSCWFANGGSTVFNELISEKAVKDLARLCQSLPVMLEVEHGRKRYGVVHGGFPYLNSSWRAGQALYKKQGHDRVMVWDRSIVDQIQAGCVIPPVTGLDYIFHGHTPVENPLVHGNRVYIDTGGVFNDRLTFCHAQADNLSFFTTGQ